jgi:hypothetical protein
MRELGLAMWSSGPLAQVLNGHSTLYFGPPAGLILFSKIVPGRMSSINILESLWTISPIKINQKLDGCAMLLLDDVL